MIRRILLLALLFAITPTIALAITHYSQAYTKAAIRSEAHAEGYGKAQTAALVHLAYHESRWHNFSRSSGGHFLGAFQIKWTMCKGNPWSNPRWNTRRAIRYLKHRYGSPVKALAHYHRLGWY
jgi:hypothetical protein